MVVMIAGAWSNLLPCYTATVQRQGCVKLVSQDKPEQFYEAYTLVPLGGDWYEAVGANQQQVALFDLPGSTPTGVFLADAEPDGWSDLVVLVKDPQGGVDAWYVPVDPQ